MKNKNVYNVGNPDPFEILKRKCPGWESFLNFPPGSDETARPGGSPKVPSVVKCTKRMQIDYN